MYRATGYRGWTAECGHEVYLSRDYYSGEMAQCEKCGRWGKIPIGFYDRIPIQYYMFISTLAVISLAGLFLFLRDAFGSPPWWIVLILLPWLAATMMFIPSWLVVMVVFKLVKGSTPESAGLVVVNRIGLRAKIGVTDIGHYLPVVIYGLLAAAYIATYFGHVSPSAWIRNPWMFMAIGAMLALLSTAVAAALAFKFAPPRLKKYFLESESEKATMEEVARIRATRMASKGRTVAFWRYKQALANRQRVLGPDHSDTLKII